MNGLTGNLTYIAFKFDFTIPDMRGVRYVMCVCNVYGQMCVWVAVIRMHCVHIPMHCVLAAFCILYILLLTYAQPYSDNGQCHVQNLL